LWAVVRERGASCVLCTIMHHNERLVIIVYATGASWHAFAPWPLAVVHSRWHVVWHVHAVRSGLQSAAMRNAAGSRSTLQRASVDTRVAAAQGTGHPLNYCRSCVTW